MRAFSCCALRVETIQSGARRLKQTKIHMYGNQSSKRVSPVCDLASCRLTARVQRRTLRSPRALAPAPALLASGAARLRL